MKCCIALRFPEKCILYFIFYIFFMILNYKTTDKLPTYNIYTEMKNNILLVFTLYTPSILFLFDFSKIKCRKRQNSIIKRCSELLLKDDYINIEETSKIKLIFLIFKYKYKIILSLFFCCLINLLKIFLIYIGIYWEQGVLSFFLMIFSISFSLKYTNFELHKHHVFASSIIIISGIIISIYTFLNDEQKYYKKICNYIYSVIFFFFDGLSNCIYNNLCNIEFINPFFIIGMNGIIMLLFFIASNIFYFKKEDLNKYIDSIKNWKTENEMSEYILWIYIILNSLFLILSDLFKIFIVKKLSPCHFCICHYILLVIKNIIYLTPYKNNFRLIFETIFQLFYIISSLIFCEIIILQFCNCDIDTIDEKKRRITLKLVDNDILSDEEDI